MVKNNSINNIDILRHMLFYVFGFVIFKTFLSLFNESVSVILQLDKAIFIECILQIVIEIVLGAVSSQDVHILEHLMRLFPNSYS